MEKKERKKTVHPTNAQKAEIRRKFLAVNGRKGIVNELKEEYQVTRQTISRIINQKTRELRDVTDEYDTKLQEKKTIELQIDTYKERAELLKLIKIIDVVPVLRKVQERHRQEQLVNQGKLVEITAPGITEEESAKLKQSVNVIENLLRGLDSMTKMDIHFHITKVLTVIQGMNDKEAEIMIPELKRMLCHKCPLFAKYQEEFK